MTVLESLYVEGVRNLVSTNLELGKTLNILYGENGAGKSSVLEAIHILSTGRSFRTRHIKNVIHHESDKLTVSAAAKTEEVESLIGVEKTLQKTTARLNREPVKRISDLSKVLPLVVLHPSSYTLLTGEPANRRAFLDWGAFHQNEAFLKSWRAYNRVLDQRNASLRSHAPTKEVTLWDDQLIEHGEKVDTERRQYLEKLNKVIPALGENLGFDYEIQCEYRSGWGKEFTFSEALNSGLDRDRQLKYTYSGPHRGDLLVRLNQHKADAVASRGQLKLTTLLLKLAQASQYQRSTGLKCLLLLDDLPSEFDQKHLDKVIKVVLENDNQCFITTINPEAIPLKNPSLTTMFHVEHGEINRTK